MTEVDFWTRIIPYIGIFPFFGTILGILISPLLQYIINKQIESRKNLSGLRYQAYVDYAKSVSDVATSSSKDRDLSKVIDSKTRICIFGNKDVIREMLNFEKSGANLKSKESQEIFTKIITEMRKDISGEKPSEEINQIINGIIFK